MRLLLPTMVVCCAWLARAEEPRPAAELEAALRAADQHIGAGKLAEAQARLDEAGRLAGSYPDARPAVSYVQAVLHAYRGDWGRAAKALIELLPAAEQRPDQPTEFLIHNMVMMLRQAQGDVAGALVECEKMTGAGRRGSWDKPEDRATLVVQKDLWHRAYLLRMLAETQGGRRKVATLRSAEEARRAYAEAAPDHPDSVAVLDGYFAALDGDRARALAAARRVNVAENEDLEDLYLTVVAFAAGGDDASAEQVRRKINQSPNVHLAAPIMRSWLARDLDARRGKPRFTPRTPRGRP